MSNRFFSPAFALALASATLSSVALAAPSNHVFEAHVSLIETVAFTGTQPCFAYSNLHGSGHAPMLGNFTVTSQDCINPQGVFDPSKPNGNAFSFASLPTGLTFITGTGDRIFATYSGTVTPRTGALPRIAGQFVVTGGTGAYFGATGGGILFGQEDLSQGVAAQGDFDLVGLMRY